MNFFKRPSVWVAIIAIVASLLSILLVGCSSKPLKSREQIWIETHPTQAGQDGQCIEFDGEDCDADPFDLDDLYESAKPKPRESVRPMRTANQPKPKTPAAKPVPKRTRWVYVRTFEGVPGR